MKMKMGDLLIFFPVAKMPTNIHPPWTCTRDMFVQVRPWREALPATLFLGDIVCEAECSSNLLTVKTRETADTVDIIEKSMAQSLHIGS